MFSSLKHCYNWQFSTNNQFVANYTVTQTIDDNEIEGLIKFDHSHKGQPKKFKEDIFRRENHCYNPGRYCFYCPVGQKKPNIGEGKRLTSTGFEQKVGYNRAQNCHGRHLLWGCRKDKG
jgi:hypothetical protein